MLISVIIPCYNVEEYIESCLNSVKQQNHQYIEIIIVDNNSIDQTVKIVETFKKKCDLKIEIIHESKQSAQAARNAGLLIAKSDWIQFLDADDLLKPTKIENQLKLIQNQNASFVAGAFERLLLNGTLEEQNLWTNTDPITAVMMSRGFLGITSSNLWHRDSIIAINGWNETLKAVHEYDLMFRLLKNNNSVIYDTQILTVIRQRVSGQISQQDPVINYRDSLKLQTNILEYLRQNKPAFLERNHSLYFQLFISHLRMLSRYDYKYSKKILQNYWPEKTILKPSSELPIIETWYAILFNLFGFNKIEYLKKLIRGY